MKKRMLAAVLSFCLLVGLLPAAALASGNDKNVFEASNEAQFYEAIDYANGTAENNAVIHITENIVLNDNLTLENITLELEDNVTISSAYRITVVGNSSIIGGANSMIKRTADTQLLFISGGAELNTKGVVFDGGAVWCTDEGCSESAEVASLDPDFNEKIIETLERSVHNIGLSTGLGLAEVGGVWNDDGSIIQNVATSGRQDGKDVTVYLNGGEDTYVNWTNTILRNCQTDIGRGTGFYGWGNSVVLNGVEMYGNFMKSGRNDNASICIANWGYNSDLYDINFHNNAQAQSTDQHQTRGIICSCDSGTNIRIHSGIIQNNAAVALRLGWSGGLITLDGGTITDNLGGACFTGSTSAHYGYLVMNGGNITDNWQNDFAGYGMSELYMTGGTLGLYYSTGYLQLSEAASINNLSLIYDRGWVWHNQYTIVAPLESTVTITYIDTEHFDKTYLRGANGYFLTDRDLAKVTCAVDGYELYLDIAANAIKVKREGDDITFTSVPVYALNYTGTFNGRPQTFSLNALEGASVVYSYTDESGVAVSDTPTKPSFTKAGTYTVQYKATADGYTETVGSVTVTINKKAIAIPKGATLTANGAEQTGVIAGAGYTLRGETATEVGTYTATATLNDVENTWWTDKKTEEKTITWSIKEAKSDVTLSFEKGEDSTALGGGTYTNTIHVSGAPESAAITYSSNKPSVATVDASGAVTPVINGIVTITASYAGDDTHNASKASYVLEITSDEESNHCVIETVQKDPTCTEAGHTEGKLCTVCDQVFAGVEEIPALEHDWDAGVVTTAPTYESEGVRTFTCQRQDCGETKTESIPKLVSSDDPVVVPSYTIKVDEMPNGTVTPSRQTAPEGRIITLTVTPDEGYKLSGITVTTVTGKELTLTDKGDGKYTFVMPGSKVTVSATFTSTGTGTNQPIVPGKDCPRDDTCPAAIFTDLDLHSWSHDGIHYCAENGLMIGVTTTTFVPFGDFTRGMLVTILYRHAGSPAVGSNVFTDVPEGAWYTDAIAWAAEKGIVYGYGDGTFGPNDAITREQMAAILYRYAMIVDKNVADLSNLDGYTDADSTSEYAVAALQWCVGNGIIKGYPDSTIKPSNVTSREEAATLIMRFCER